jgi:hypothetical protein
MKKDKELFYSGRAGRLANFDPTLSAVVKVNASIISGNISSSQNTLKFSTINTGVYLFQHLLIDI